jgi:DNA-binding NtrC family response regulator
MQRSKILIVDDEENILSALKRLFRNEDYEILTAQSGEEALSTLEQQPVDLIVSDLKMPNMNGIEFLAKAKEISPGPLRIMLTGHADLKSVIEAIDRGEVYRFLLKPWNNDELKMTIRQALDFYYVQKDNQALVKTVKKQNQMLKDLEAEHPGIAEVRRDQDGSVLLEVDDIVRKYDQGENGSHRQGPTERDASFVD